MDDLRWLVDDARAAGASHAEARLVDARRVSVEVLDGETKKAIPGEERGVSIRALVKGAWGFAATNDLSRASLSRALADALATARALSARKGERVTLADAKPAVDKVAWTPKRDATTMPLAEIAGALAEFSDAARETKQVASAKLSLDADVTTTRFWSSEGADLTMTVPHLLLQIDLVAREGAHSPVSFRERIGGTRGWEIFRDDDPFAKAREAATSAARLLTAKPCPSGRMTVIADSVLTGVFAHEAVGHACEADLVIAGESLLEGRIGETLGSPEVTIVDDGTVPGGFGSAPYDDEGVRGSRKTLVEGGVLRGFILSRETAGRLKMTPNGGARAQDYGSRPLVRMSNTLVAPQDRSFEELLEGVKRGIYAKGTRGGQVDVAKGTFQFGAQEAWLVENGKLTTPLKDAALQGSILDTLRTIDAVGKEAKLAQGICGKGQWVPVGDGGPPMRMQGATVGGGA